jgi:hypothetical protein
MTGPVVYLNKVRKARDRSAQKAQADAHALKHGRTKAQKRLEASRADKAKRTLDGAKFEE